MDNGAPRGILDGPAHTGPDGIFGSQDDVDRDFGVDIFSTLEPFRGIQDTLNVIAFGLATGKAGSAVQTTTLWPAVVDLLMAGQEAGQTSVVPSSQESDSAFTVLADSVGKPIFVGQSANTLKDDLFDVTSAKRSGDETEKRFEDSDLMIGQSLAAEENLFDPLGL
jgi:hypothetical protein